MLFRKLFDFIFASPVMIVFSVVSVACASILVVKISSNTSLLSEAGGIASNTDDNGALIQSYDSSPDRASNNLPHKPPVNVDQSDDLNSARKPAQNFNKNKNREWYFENEVDGLPSGGKSESEADYNYNESPALNFSSGNYSNNASTTSVITTDKDENTDPDIQSTEQEYPDSLDYEVIDGYDEVQSVSCRPVEANGPPCMCTYTTTDADSSVSNLVDNCS